MQVKKFAGAFIVIMVMIGVLGLFSPEQMINVNAATKKEISTKNKKVHKAFLTCVKKYKKDHAMDDTKLRYLFIDLDGDKIDELVTYPGYGTPTYIVYNYKKGKVVEIATIGHQEIQYFYEDSGVLYAYGMHMGMRIDSYYKLEHDTWECVAQKVVNYYDFGTLLEEPLYTYYIENKQVSKTEFSKYVKTLKKGKKINFSKIEWMEY